MAALPDATVKRRSRGAYHGSRGPLKSCQGDGNIGYRSSSLRGSLVESIGVDVDPGNVPWFLKKSKYLGDPCIVSNVEEMVTYMGAKHPYLLRWTPLTRSPLKLGTTWIRL